jgi:hypothetical protein
MLLIITFKLSPGLMSDLTYIVHIKWLHWKYQYFCITNLGFHYRFLPHKNIDYLGLPNRGSLARGLHYMETLKKLQRNSEINGFPSTLEYLLFFT